MVHCVECLCVSLSYIWVADLQGCKLLKADHFWPTVYFLLEAAV